MPEVPLPRATRLPPGDVLRLGTVGVRTRPVRTVLAALGIAIGIAALIAVVSIPASNQAALRAQLAALGPNLLTVVPGTNIAGGKATTQDTTTLEDFSVLARLREEEEG